MKRTQWTTDKIEALKAIYPMRSDASVAEILGVTIESVQSMARKVGIKKSRDYLRKIQAEKAKKRHAVSIRPMNENVMTEIKPGRVRYVSTCGFGGL